MKKYFGRQNQDKAGPIDIFVNYNSKITKLVHIVRHSPDGFQIGYSGSGPADTALSILADCVSLDVANAFYQEFKWQIVAGWKESFEITEKEIKDWILSITKKREEMRGL